MDLASISLVKPVIALVGLAAVGVGGYNLVTTGCPLGTCQEEAAVTTAATSTGDECALGCGSCDESAKTVQLVADEAKSCCDSEGATQLVADEAKSGCCESEAAAAVQLVADKATDSCEGKTDCSTPCEGKDAATVQLVAAGTCEGKSDCAEKSDCSTPCEGKDAATVQLVSTEAATAPCGGGEDCCGDCADGCDDGCPLETAQKETKTDGNG